MVCMLGISLQAQVTERERPAEWEQLVKGARFMDRFLPMPQGKTAQGIWGTDSVQNRYIDNALQPYESKMVQLDGITLHNEKGTYEVVFYTNGKEVERNVLPYFEEKK